MNMIASKPEAAPMEPLRDQTMLRQTLSCFPTGVAIITTMGEAGLPVGVTVSSFNSVSMDPPLILWSLANNAGTRSAFHTHPTFVVNILSAEQEETCKRFARPGEDRFNEVEWTPGHGGAPVLLGTAATLECDIYQRHPGGDHEIFLGQVMRATASDLSPLVFAKGQLGALAFAES